MKDVSIWFKRILYLSKVDFEEKGYSIDDLLKKIKSVKKIPYLFSGVYYKEGIQERKWYSKRRLELFIKLAIFFNIYEIKEELIYKTDTAKKILDPKSRSLVLKEKAIESLDKRFGLSEEKLLNSFEEIDSPITAKILARYLKIVITYEELILFEATIEIYCDVSEVVVWTGKITFGISYQVVNLRDKLTKEQLELINDLCIKCKNKNNCIKKIKEAIKQGLIPATLEKEAKEICLEKYEQQKARNVRSIEIYDREIDSND